MSNGLRDDINIWPSSVVNKRPMPTKIKVDAAEALDASRSGEIRSLAVKIARLSSLDSPE